jgi:hypothetical protein
VNWIQLQKVSFETSWVDVSVGRTNARSDIMGKYINNFGEVGNGNFISAGLFLSFD